MEEEGQSVQNISKEQELNVKPLYNETIHFQNNSIYIYVYVC